MNPLDIVDLLDFPKEKVVFHTYPLVNVYVANWKYPPRSMEKVPKVVMFIDQMVGSYVDGRS